MLDKKYVKVFVLLCVMGILWGYCVPFLITANQDWLVALGVIILLATPGLIKKYWK